MSFNLRRMPFLSSRLRALPRIRYPAAMIYLQANRQSCVENVIQMIAEYDYSCFVDARVRDIQNSLKIGFSPDHTTVFLDVLDLAYPTEGQPRSSASLSRTSRPNSATDSARSPSPTRRRQGAAGLQNTLLVPFSGEGSYFFPLFLDPNDILVKSVPKMPAQSTFIDTTWLQFVHQLNLSLRCVNFDFLDRSLGPVLECLDTYMRGAHKSTLGSLEVQLVKISYAADTIKSLPGGSSRELDVFGSGLSKHRRDNVPADRAPRWNYEPHDRENENSDYINADYYCNNTNNFTRASGYVSRRDYDFDSQDEDENSYESSDDTEDADRDTVAGTHGARLQARAESDSDGMDGDTSSPRQSVASIRGIANGSMVGVPFVSGVCVSRRLGAITCHASPGERVGVEYIGTETLHAGRSTWAVHHLSR